MEILKSKKFYIALFLVLIFLFIFQNLRTIEINFLFWNLIRVNLALLLSITFILGLGIGSFTTWSRYRKQLKRPWD